MEENFKKQHSLLESTIEIQEDLEVYSIDKKFCYLYFNKSHADRMKTTFNCEIQLGRRISKYISSKNDNATFHSNYNRAFKGETFTNTSQLDHHYFENVFNPIIIENEIVGITVISKNITEQKQADWDSDKVHKKLRSVLKAIPDLMFEVGIDGKIFQYHPSHIDFLAVPPKKFLGKYFQEILPEAVSKICIEALLEANEKGYSGGQQYALEFEKGKHWFELSVSPINESDNKEKHFILLARNITNRKKTEEKLLANDAFLNQTQIIANLGSYSLDLFTRKWKSSQVLDSIFGIDSQFDKSIEGWEAIIHPKWRPIMNDFFSNKVIEKQSDFNKEYKIIRQNDLKERWVCVNGKLIFNDCNQPIKMIGTVQDITERKEKIEELEKLNRAHALNNQINDLILRTQNRAVVFKEVCKIAVDYGKFRMSWIGILDPITNEISPITSYGFENGYLDIINKITTKNIAEGNGPTGSAMREGKIFISNDVANDPIMLPWRTECLLRSYQSLIAIPIIVRSRTTATFTLYSDEINFFTNDEEIKLLRRIAENIAFSLETILVEEERKKAEEERSNAEERFRELVDSTGGILWEADANTFLFTYVSKQAERLLGYPPEEWYTPDFWGNHIHQADKEKTIEYCVEQTKQKLAHDFSYRFITKKGKTIWLKDSVTVVLENGKPKWLRGVMLDISSHKKTEEGLRESEEKYRSLVENSPDAVVIYVRDKIVFINEEGLRMVGAKVKEEIIGKKVLQFIHPESTESIVQRMSEVLQINSTSNIIEEKLIDLYCNPIDVELKAIPTKYEQKDAIQVIIHNITERKRTQEKIKQLSQAVEQSPVTIIITNTEGNIEYVNPKFTETSGYTFEEITGKNPRVLKSGHTSSNEYKELWNTLREGNEWHGEFHNITKKGALYWESAYISPILNAQGKATHYIAIKEDITSRKMAEQELIKAKEKAEESDRLKLAFLANMSHEIRTPMNGILGFTELLKVPNLSTKVQQEYVSIIETSGLRMLNIINDIISISKVESGQIEVFLSETNVNEQIEYMNNFFKPEATQKGIQLFIKNTLPTEEAVIITDCEKTYAILTNLVKNAVKFTDSGSIEIGYTKKEKYLEFFVKDTGQGISTSQQKIIFERFRQADDTISRAHEGSGLGLAISKAYVEILGGQIWVESAEGKGSCFYYTIPLDKKLETEDKIIFKKDITEQKSEIKIKNLKVLIVEDDPISKLLITIAVKPFSKEILKVSTGFEAIEACRNNKDIDLVMMDINMPEMGGYEATKEIRKFNKDLIIIAQTANGMQSDRDESLTAGCTDYISKPVNIAVLGELIQTYYKK